MAQVATIIGGGVIGGGWAARFLLAGWDVRVFDPDPEAASGRGIDVSRDNVRGCARRRLDPRKCARAVGVKAQSVSDAASPLRRGGGDWIVNVGV